MTSREKLEAWLSEEYEWGPGAIESAFFQGDDLTGHYVGGNFIYNGHDCSDALFWAWRGWQASRDEEIELPQRQEPTSSGHYGEGYLVASSAGSALDYEDTVDAIRAAGFKVKGGGHDLHTNT